MGLFTATPSALLMRDSEGPPSQIIANVMDTFAPAGVNVSERHVELPVGRPVLHNRC